MNICSVCGGTLEKVKVCQSLQLFKDSTCEREREVSSKSTKHYC